MLKNFDTQFFSFLNSYVHKWPVLDQILLYANEYGLYVFAVLAALYFFSNRAIFWRIAIAVALGRGLITEGIRYFYHRPRPFVNEQLENVRQMIDKNVVNDSFPSGHAAFYFSLAFAVYFYSPTTGKILLGVAIVLSLARVYFGVHYPSDILGGAIVGLASAWIADKIVSSRE